VASRNPRGPRKDKGIPDPPAPPDPSGIPDPSGTPDPSGIPATRDSEGIDAPAVESPSAPADVADESATDTATDTDGTRTADQEAKKSVAVDGFTIGEVLNQLRDDFEDITISKIRFLESEGLISPDRTESGYRKFSEDDVDRLRFILIAQRDHFLPLKVIREQLARVDAGEPATTPSGAPLSAPASVDGDDDPAPAPLAKALQAAIAGAGGDEGLLVEPEAPVSLTWREFCDVTELDAAEVKALRDYGIIGIRGGDQATFDGDDLLAGLAARELLNLGLEPRHLRMYRQFVDREVALFEQLVTPLLRQRNPEARRQATQRLETLAALTGRMKRSLLARELRGSVHGS